jgi:hypothetical protein
MPEAMDPVLNEPLALGLRCARDAGSLISLAELQTWLTVALWRCICRSDERESSSNR